MLFISIPLPAFIAIVVLIVIAVIAFFVIRKIDNKNMWVDEENWKGNECENSEEIANRRKYEEKRMCSNCFIVG